MRKAVQLNFLIFLPVVIMSFHWLLIKIPPVNLEFAFVDAAQYFLSSNQSNLLIDQYFYYQANTLGLPYLASLIARIFYDVDILVLIRVINILGVGLLSFSVIWLAEYLGKNKIVILMLVLLNPLVWTFSERATADFFPMALGVFAIALTLLRGGILLNLIMPALIFGCAVILKYHVLGLLFLIAAIHLGDSFSKNNLIRLFVFGAITMIMLCIYVLKVRSVYGFYFTPPRYQSIHKLNPALLLNNFVLYTGFLALLCLPTFLVSKEFWHCISQKKRLLFLMIGIFVVISFKGVADSGELNFGPLDYLLGPHMRLFILLTIGLATFFLFFQSMQSQSWNKQIVYIGFSLLFVIFLLSISRPSQRYLILLIPFFILFLPDDLLKSRVLVALTLVMFTLSNFWIELSRHATATASKNLVLILESSNLLRITEAGAIEPHQGNRFYFYKDQDKKYEVVSGDKLKNPNSILSITQHFFMFEKSFSVVPIR